MSIRKRILALAAAGVAAVLLGSSGVLNTARPAHASQPTLVLVGCSNTVNDGGASITFPATPSVTGSAITSFVQSNPAATLALATPLGVVLCGVIAQDPLGPVPVIGNDTNPNTVDPASFRAVVNAPAVILESNQTQFSWNCGAGITPESCASGIGFGATVSPVPGNTYHVALNNGSTFGIVGTSTPIITTNVTWNPTIALETPVTSPSVTIGIVVPQYTFILTANPGTIPANLPTSTNVQGSVITAFLYHIQTGNACVVLVSGTQPTYACNLAAANLASVTSGAGGYLLSPGAETGTVIFSTNLGLWANAGAAPAGPSIVSVNAATQTISVHCGAVPNTFPTSLFPTYGLVTTLTLTSCQSVTATLVGGGEAGTATIVANFIGDYTGATSNFGVQGETQVNLTPGPITVALTTGCNEVITPPNLAGGSTGTQVVALATGFNVTSIWVFNNASHTFAALFFPGTAPTDIFSIGPNSSVFICGTGAGTFRVA